MQKIISFGILSILVATIAFAHGDLENLSKQEIIELQKSLVKDGYLKTESGFRWGVADSATDEARDKRAIEESIEKIKAKNKEAQERIASSSAQTNTEAEVETNIFQKIINFFKNLF